MKYKMNKCRRRHNMSRYLLCCCTVPQHWVCWHRACVLRFDQACYQRLDPSLTPSPYQFLSLWILSNHSTIFCHVSRQPAVAPAPRASCSATAATAGSLEPRCRPPPRQQTSAPGSLAARAAAVRPVPADWASVRPGPLTQVYLSLVIDYLLLWPPFFTSFLNKLKL